MNRDELIAATAKLWVDEGLRVKDFEDSVGAITWSIYAQELSHDAEMRIERQIDKDQEELHGIK
jgi:hypothetical protein